MIHDGADGFLWNQALTYSLLITSLVPEHRNFTGTWNLVPSSNPGSSDGGTLQALNYASPVDIIGA